MPEKDEPPMSIGGMFQTFGRVYGPYAFGFIALFMVWYAIVAPTLAANRIDMAALRSITDSLSKIASSIETTANKMERISERLNGGRP